MSISNNPQQHSENIMLNQTTTQILTEANFALDGYAIKCYADGAIKEIHGRSPAFKSWTAIRYEAHRDADPEAEFEPLRERLYIARECSRCDRKHRDGDVVFSKIFVYRDEEGQSYRQREVVCKGCAEKHSLI